MCSRDSARQTIDTLDLLWLDLMPSFSFSLGTGMFGRVILVHDIPTKKYFALKVMNISAVIKLKQIQHVLSEKDVLKSISHPFIVNL